MFLIVSLLVVASAAAGVATLIGIDRIEREQGQGQGQHDGTTEPDPARTRKAAETALWWSASTLIWGTILALVGFAIWSLLG